MDDRLKIIRDAPLSYLVMAPKRPAARLPLLCFLHGYDEAAPRAIREALISHGPLHPNALPLVADRFIVLAPQLPIAGDHWSHHAADIAHIIERLQQLHAIDERRRYLTGFSFGGNGVFDLALLQPQQWTALWAVDPTRVPRAPIDAPLWLSFGEAARYRKSAFIERLGVAPYDARQTRKHVYLDQGQDHVQSAALAYTDARIYDWLLAQA